MDLESTTPEREVAFSASDVSMTGMTRRQRHLMEAVLIVVVAGVALLALWFFWGREDITDSAPELVSIVSEPTSGEVITTRWTTPSAVDIVGDRAFVLDSGNNRILDMDLEGVVDRIICESGECAFLLDNPQDLEVHGEEFWVANTDAGQVDVVDAGGAILRTFVLPESDLGPPRATGLFLADDGRLYVSDGTAGRVAIFGSDGTFNRYFGANTRVGEYEFSDPNGIEVDSAGNIYVAEYSAGRVRKISPEGRELATYWMVPGITAASEITDLTIADNGYLYMTDTKRSLAHVFDVGATYLGIVGLFDASRVGSPNALMRPNGIDTQDDLVFVMDRVRGLLTFKITPAYFEYYSR